MDFLGAFWDKFRNLSTKRKTKGEVSNLMDMAAVCGAQKSKLAMANQNIILHNEILSCNKRNVYIVYIAESSCKASGCVTMNQVGSTCKA